jgi:cation diffusion facilitator CzcD-associated flavoprotein CzcO
MHSHDYRVPDIFRDMSVVVLGAGSSGIDISIEISRYAKKVINFEVVYAHCMG